MITQIILAFIGIIIFFIVTLFKQKYQAIKPAVFLEPGLSDVARERGYPQVEAGSRVYSKVVEGRTVELFETDAPDQSYRFRVTAPPDTDTGFRACKRNGRALGGFVSGDSILDGLVAFESADPLRLIAFLDGETRERIIEISSGNASFEIQARGIEVRFSFDTETKLACLLAIARRLYSGLPVAESIFRIALHDANPTVRTATLDALKSGFGRRPEIRVLVESRLKDDDWAVRLAAAEIAGASDCVLEALRSSSLSWIRIEALRLVARMRVATAISTLIEILRNEKRPEVLIAALETARSLRDRTFVEPLLGRLRDEAWEIRVASAEALGECGAIAEVEPLQACLSAYPMDVDLHRAVDAAVAAIQARAGGEAGRISEADSADTEGRLSEGQS